MDCESHASFVIELCAFVCSQNYCSKRYFRVQKLLRELRIWAKLDHDCVLPLLGYVVEGEGMLPNLVSEWMNHGTVDEFMEDFPRGGEETWNMVRDAMLLFL